MNIGEHQPLKLDIQPSIGVALLEVTYGNSMIDAIRLTERQLGIPPQPIEFIDRPAEGFPAPFIYFPIPPPLPDVQIPDEPQPIVMQPQLVEPVPEPIELTELIEVEDVTVAEAETDVDSTWPPVPHILIPLLPFPPVEPSIWRKVWTVLNMDVKDIAQIILSWWRMR